MSGRRTAGARSAPVARRGLTALLTAMTTALLTAAGLVVTAGTASADGFGSSGPSSPPSSSASASRTTGSGCHMYGSAAGYGVVCPSAGGGSLRDVLGGSSVPTCWYEDPPDSFVPPFELFDGDDRRWYLKGCMAGFNDRAVQTGQIIFAFDFEPRLPQYAFRLDERQREFLRRIQQNAQIPLPVVQSAPSASPRIGDDTAFYVLEEFAEAPTITFDSLRMRARMVYFEMRPGGVDGDDVVGCPGRGIQVTEDDTPQTEPNACWYEFERSSSGVSSGNLVNRYRSHATAYWRVEFSEDGGNSWGELGTFPKEALAPVRVTEIQTLVIR